LPRLLVEDLEAEWSRERRKLVVRKMDGPIGILKNEEYVER
jgi:hypothetical protein